MTGAARLAIPYGRARRHVLLLGQASRSTRIAKLNALRLSTIRVLQVLRLIEETLLVSLSPE